MKRAIEEDLKRNLDITMSMISLDANQILEKSIKRAIMKLRKEGDADICKIFSLFNNDADALAYLVKIILKLKRK